MARRKIPTSQKKVTLTLTVKPSIKEMLIAISDVKETSISVLLEEYAVREYTKLMKEKKCVEINIPGQMKLEDMNENSNTVKNTDKNTCENETKSKRKCKKNDADDLEEL